MLVSLPSRRPLRPPCNPLMADCLTYALEHDIREGVWGGTSENERRKLRQQQRKAVA